MPLHNGRPADPGALAATPHSLISFQTVWTAVRRWWLIALPLGVLAACAVVAGSMHLIKPQYTATAWLTIRDRPDFTFDPTQREDPLKFVENQQQLLHSIFVLQQVVDDPEIASIPELADEDQPAEALREQLRLRAQGRSDFFTMEFKSVDRERVALVVNRVAEAYVKVQGQTQAARNRQLIEGLRQEQAAQQKIVEDLRKKVATLNLEIAKQDPAAQPSRANVIELRNSQSQLESQLVTAEVEHAVAKARLQAAREMARTESFTPLVSEVEHEIRTVPGVQLLRTTIRETNQKLREFERTAANVQKSAPYLGLTEKLKADEAELERLITEERDRLAANHEKQAREKRASELAQLQRQVTSQEFTASILRERLQEDRQEHKDVNGDSIQLEFARADYDQATKVYEAIANRIHGLQLDTRAPARVEIFRAAEVPAHSDGFPLNKVVVLALAALAAPFVIAVGFEHLLQRVADRAHLESDNIPVLGEISSAPRQLRKVFNSRYKPCRNSALFHESLHCLRTHLSMAEAPEDFSVIAITSAVSGEGKSLLAAQLAMNIAMVTGEPTLLIDADMRLPDLHRFFKVNLEGGLAEVLEGDVAVEDVVKTLEDSNLHLLTAGLVTSNPHRLVSGSRFEALLEELKATYAHIVIDTPPLLSASESLVMARAADRTLVCVRRDYSRFHQATEAFRRLTAAAVRTAGAVLTDVAPRTYLARYGRYVDSRPVEQVATRRLELPPVSAS
jgi:succinoglycan biosynthesis transport protein ExoP